MNKRFGLAIFVFAIALIGRSEKSPEGLDALLRLGIQQSPRLAAARTAWRAAIETIPQAAALPDPAVSYDYFGEAIETRVGPQRQRIGVSQSIPYPGTRRRSVAVANAEVNVQQHRYEQAVWDFVVDLTVRYHELLYLRDAQAITRQNQALAEHALTLATKRHAAGNAKLADLLSAQGRAAQLGYDVQLLAELEQVEIVAINALLNRPSDQALATPRPTPLSPVELSTTKLETLANTSPAVTIAEAMANKRQQQTELAGLEQRPKLAIRGTHIDIGEADRAQTSDSGKDAWLLGLNVSLPIWPGKNRSKLREAELNHQAASHHLDSVKNDIRAKVRQLHFRLQNAQRLVTLYEQTLLPQAQSALTIAEQNAADDVSGFLQTQSVWLNFNLAKLRAATDHQQYLARLEAVVGQRLRPPQADGGSAR